MKLAAHYNKASIIISISVLLISGIIYYITINHIARTQLDNNLVEEIEEVELFVKVNHHLPKQVDFDEDVTTFTKTKLTKYPKQFFDAVYTNPKEKKTEQGRAVAALISLNGINYILKIVVSRESTEFLIQVISIITLLLAVILLSILVITNKLVLNKLWQPFYHILFQVQRFNVSDSTQITTYPSNVEEFEQLSIAISTMSSRVIMDYQGLKAFTENASHEMMTPIAVITSKLDTLIQDESLNSDQLSHITDVYSATNKLSRLNQSLLLLVKIENDLIQEDELLNLKSLLLEKAHQFQEMIQSKYIDLEIKADDLEIKASKYLIDILINNLFSNAIRHNAVPEKIRISLTGRKLLFQNSGENNPLREELMFERFYKGRSSDGTGLGLALIKNICSKYKYKLAYQFVDHLHTFSIEF